MSAAGEKMRAAGLPEPAIAAFERHVVSVRAGGSGTLPDRDIEPVTGLPDAAALAAEPAHDALDRAVVLKLNGGLGTSMAVTGPKALVEAREGLTFLDLVARQTLALRRRHGVRLPLVLMHSFATRERSIAALERYPELGGDVPLDFVQHRVPKLHAGDLEPVEWPAAPALEWCPPGHGDLYAALATSGMLATLLDRGYRYAFASNVDNLGAVLDRAILGWFAASGAPFAMEVVIGTDADRKGGHIARRRDDGRLVLRETAQTPAQDAASFRDHRRWRYYNTNNLWLDLRALRDVLAERAGVLGLPLIVNRKTVDPADADSTPVVQLETAMGAAISVFDGAAAVCVPRARFAPVKTTNDLLVLRSDVYGVDDDARVVPAAPEPFVDLDPAYFARLRDFEARFPAGPPSLRGCERFVVRGDATFGRGVRARGRVEVVATPGSPARIEDGARLGAARETWHDDAHG